MTKQVRLVLRTGAAFFLLYGYLYYMCTYLLLQTVQNDVLTAHFPVQVVSGRSRHILMPTTVHSSRVSGHLLHLFFEEKKRIKPREDKGEKIKITTMCTLKDDVNFFSFFSLPNTTADLT